MTDKPRALLVWELGDNLGHIAPLVKVGEDLCRRGFDVYLALQNLTGVASVIGDTPLKILQAPYARVKAPRDAARPVLVYADDLRPCGYDDPQELAILIRAWDELFQLVRPSLLIGNSSPTAFLAAQAHDFAKVNIGLGYEVPVLSTPMLPLRHWEPVNIPLLKTHEGTVLAIINDALKILGREPLEAIQDIFKNQTAILTTFPELDHYGPRQDDVYVGPVFIADKGVEAAWPERATGRKRIFAYLSHGQSFEAAFRALQNQPHDVILVARRLPQHVVNTYNKPPFQIFREAIRLGPLAAECDLCLTHGGTGTLIQFLLQGVPQLVIPNHIEQAMVAKRIEAMGAGRVTPAKVTEAEVHQLITGILATPAYHAAAAAWADGHRGYTVDAQMDGIMGRIMAAFQGV